MGGRAWFNGMPRGAENEHLRQAMRRRTAAAARAATRTLDAPEPAPSSRPPRPRWQKPVSPCEACGDDIDRGMLPSSRLCGACTYKKRIVLTDAHAKVALAIEEGRLQKGCCEVCGKSETFGHHDDYAQPLNVRWLCRYHHWRWHNENGYGANAFREIFPNRAATRLVLAAPGLLTALKECVAALQICGTDELAPVIDDARAAIARAEGH